MKISIPLLQETFKDLNYTWDNSINLIGIRTSLQVPDVFNDIFFAIWKQPAPPSISNVLADQKWLNSWLFVGANGKPLVEDGIPGKNTTYAKDMAYKLNGQYRIKSWTFTADPGTYYLENPLSKKGTAVLKSGQYIKSYALGHHRKKESHPALLQVGKVTVYRDNDKDDIAETIGNKLETGFFGINIHRASSNVTSKIINKWSAGCQVFANKKDHTQLLTLCRNFREAKHNRFTYTLINEKMLKNS